MAKGDSGGDIDTFPCSENPDLGIRRKTVKLICPTSARRKKRARGIPVRLLVVFVVSLQSKFHQSTPPSSWWRSVAKQRVRFTLAQTWARRHFATTHSTCVADASMTRVRSVWKPQAAVQSQVSSLGRFRSSRGVVTTPKPQLSGYVRVQIKKKKHAVHRLRHWRRQ